MSEATTAPPAGPVPESMPAIYAAICDIMNAVPYVEKDKTSDHGGYKFRGIDQVLNAVGPKMRDHCVFAVPRMLNMERTTTTSKAGGGLMNTIVEAEFDFYSGADGSKITIGPVPGEAMDSGDKSTAKAMSVAYRTALIQLLAIPTGDPDPDHDVYERAGHTAAPAGGPARSHRPRAADADPWANSNPKLVTYYREAIDATGTDDALKVIWGEILNDLRDDNLAKVDGDELSIAIKRRRATIAQDAAAEQSQ